MNIPTIIVALIVAAIFLTVIIRGIIKRKKGQGSCGCGCDCGACGLCHPSDKEADKTK